MVYGACVRNCKHFANALKEFGKDWEEKKKREKEENISRDKETRKRI